MSQSKRRVVLAALTIILLTMLPGAIALADCRITSTSNGNDNVTCSDPDDTNGISTGGGNDYVYVRADTEVRSSGTTIDTGSGNDRVENRGRVISTGGDPVNLRAGVDTLDNYGYIQGSDDGVWCTPYSGHTCTYNNYSGASILATNEAIDIYNQGGTMVLNNWGLIRSTYQEVAHFHSTSGSYTVNNRGTMEGRRNVIEVSSARVTVYNSGRITSSRQGGIWLAGQSDRVENTGTIQGGYDPALYFSGGSDTLVNRGTIEASNDSSSYAAAQMGSGNDIVTTSGNIRELGSGYASIALEGGNDQITIQGGQINKQIHGGDGTDVLTFQFNGTTSEVEAFRRQVNSQSPGGGSATWRSQTYRWSRFETIRMILNGTTYTKTASASTADTMEAQDVAVDGADTTTSTAQDDSLSISSTPTEEPTVEPTIEPTAVVTEEPTPTPTEDPTSAPTDQPTEQPTIEPTAVVTEEPTPTPTEDATEQPTQQLEPPVLTAGYYEESAEGIVYTGSWAYYRARGASGDGFMRTRDPDASVTFRFEGTRLTLFRSLHRNRGAMEVCIDGVCQTIKNHANGLTLAAPVVFDVPEGIHEVVIRNLSGQYIDLDAVQIETGTEAAATEDPSVGDDPAPTVEPTEDSGTDN